MVGAGTLDTTGEGRTAFCGDEFGRAEPWLGGFGIEGAWTTLRLGPGPSAIPSGADGAAPSRRGITAPPATAIASRRAAITLSLPLMSSPPPADTISQRTYRQEGAFA